jgi:hypothetical protein
MYELRKALEILLEMETAKINELDRLNHLIEEFMDIDIALLLWIRDYCDKHNIPLWKEPEFTKKIDMASRVLKEIKETSIDIEALIKSHKLPLKKFYKRSPEDLPEPKKESYLYLKLKIMSICPKN